MEATAYSTIGYVQQQLGRFADAVGSHGRALAICKQSLDDYYLAEVLDNLASAQLQLGEAESARDNWLRAADIYTGLRVARAAEMRANAEAVASVFTAAEAPASEAVGAEDAGRPSDR